MFEKISKEDELEIVKLYDIKKYTLRRIAREFNTDHHRIERILKNNSIKISNIDRVREPFTEERRKKIGKASKGRKFKTRHSSKETIYKNMAAHIRFNVDVEFLKQFDDIKKLCYLNRCITNRDKRWDNVSDEWYKKYLLKFYNDDNFNKLYIKFNKSNNKYIRPSIDHIIPKSKGGSNDLNNLRFISWFENRCKNDMNLSEWEEIKKHIEEYFI